MDELDVYIDEIISKIDVVMGEEELNFKDALKVVKTAINYRELKIIEQKLDCICDAIDHIG